MEIAISTNDMTKTGTAHNLMRAKDGMMWGMEWDSPGNSAAALVTVPLRLQPYYVMQLGRWLQVSSFAPKQRPLHSNPCVLRNAGALGP